MNENIEKKLIALVDDDPEIISTVTDYLKGCGFRVKGFQLAETFFEFLEEHTPDLIVLDIVLPDMSGFQICKKLKDSNEFKKIPIIILSGQSKEADKVFGLDLGADDYMVKPYSLNELSARVNAVLRRKPEGGQDEVTVIGRILVIDRSRYKVTVDGVSCDLTPTEFKILELLASRRGQVFTRETILNYLWGDEKIVVDRTIDVHIRHLREKLVQAGSFIKVVRGVGYKIEEPEDGPEEGSGTDSYQ